MPRIASQLYIPPVFFLMICVPVLIFSQEVIRGEVYTQAYYDSIRTLVNDSTNARYTVQAYRIEDHASVETDGELNEPVWQRAEHYNNFVEKDPYPLVEMSDETEFAVLYDSESIYIGIWCWDSEPAKIDRQILPRGRSNGDNVQIFFDTYHDKRTGYKFTVSPSGGQLDELRYDDFKRDNNWNGVWYSQCTIDSAGWYVEAKIPFYNLRFRETDEQVWGFNILRTISKNASRGQWKPHLPEWDLITRMSTLGDLVGLQNISPGRSFELRPYATTGMAETAPDPAAGQFSVGLDARYSPTTSITADATLNPDFAQVDADVLEINLTRYPTRFRELRPFFTERTNIFNTPMELFYSRRIGANGDILAGGKLSGKFQNGFEFGTLSAWTGESPLSPAQSSEVLKQDAAFVVARLKKDLFRSSSLGILAATKEMPQNLFTRVIGLDGSFSVTSQDLLDFQIAGSETDSFSSRNMGYVAEWTRTGDNFGFVGSFERYEPFFEINRVGFLRKETFRGVQTAEGVVRISPRLNKYWMRRISLNLGLALNQDLFTDQYLNRWLIRNSGVDLDPVFGDISPGSIEEPDISSGQRHFKNLQPTVDLGTTFMNEMELGLIYKQVQATEPTGQYTGEFWTGTFSTRPVSKGVRYAGTLTYSGGTYYNFAAKYVGTRQGIRLAGDGLLTNRLSTRFQGEYTLTFDPEGNQDGKFYQVSTNTIFMFNKDMYIRGHLQGRFGTTNYLVTDIFNQYLLSMLFTWEFQPGSFFYVAYNESRIDEDNPFRENYFMFTDRTLFIKLSHLFHL